MKNYRVLGMLTLSAAVLLAIGSAGSALAQSRASGTGKNPQAMTPGNIYKWTDANGKTHYSDRPESSHKGEMQIYSSRSVMLKTVIGRELTDEELRAKADEEKIVGEIQEKDKQVSEANKRRDMALLSTYNGVADLDRVRDFEIGLIERSMRNDKLYIEELKKNLSELEAYKDSSGKAPTARIERVKSELADAEKQMNKNQELKDIRSKKFAEDKKRLEELLAAQAPTKGADKEEPATTASR